MQHSQSCELTSPCLAGEAAKAASLVSTAQLDSRNQPTFHFRTSPAAWEIPQTSQRGWLSQEAHRGVTQAVIWPCLQLQKLFLTDTCVGKQRAKVVLSSAQGAKGKEQLSDLLCPPRTTREMPFCCNPSAWPQQDTAQIATVSLEPALALSRL